MKKIFCFILILQMVFGVTSLTYAVTFSIQQLTNNSYHDLYPRISGNNVTWIGSDGSDLEIFYYDGSSVIQLTNDAYDAGNPQISGNNVVWPVSDGSDEEIFYYDGVSVMQLTNNSYDDLWPQISGNNVVWGGSDGSEFEIFYYDGVSVIQLTNNSYDDRLPQISGNNVTWEGSDGSDYEIFYYDGISTTQLTTNVFEDRYPQISGSNVVWTGFDGSDYEIFYYDGISVTQVTNNSYDDEYPAISGSNIAWAGFDGSDYEMYLYDGLSITQLTDNSYDDRAARISGSTIAWIGLDESDYEVFYYDGTAVTQVTDNNYHDVNPWLSGSTLVWEGDDGLDREIFLATPVPFSLFDTNHDWIIGDFELLKAIDDWASGLLGDFELLNLIDFWASGNYCWDTLTESYKVGIPDQSGVCPTNNSIMLEHFNKDSYLPIVENATWTYNYGETVMVTNVNTTTTTFKIVNLDTFGSMDGIEKNDSFGNYISASGFSGPEFMPIRHYFGFRPLIYEDSKMTLGFSWQDSGESNGYPFTNTLTVISIDTNIMTASGHNFDNCLVLQRDITYPNGYDWNRYLVKVIYYLKKGVGYVQEVKTWSDGFQETNYVTSYNIP